MTIKVGVKRCEKCDNCYTPMERNHGCPVCLAAEVERLTTEVNDLKWRLGYAETALGVWDDSRTSEYWEKYPNPFPMPTVSGREGS